MGELEFMGEIALRELENGGWDERVRVFRAGIQLVDTAVILTERYAVLVDTMATPELAAEIVERVRDALDGRQLLVVNTHADWDHCWGNATFAPGGPHRAPIIAHERTCERLRSEEARQTLEEKQRDSTNFASVRLVAPDVTFETGLRLHGGDLTLELLPTPGHTPDHTSVWIPELRLLLAGDAAEYPFPYVGDSAVLPTLRESLRKMAALAPATVILCHSGAWDAGLLARNIAYFDDLEQRSRTALAAGVLPADWREREDLPELLGLPYEAALQAQGVTPGAMPESWDYHGFHLRACRAAVLDVSARA